MDRESIHAFMSEVAGPNIELIDHPSWVSFRCVLAPWTHERGTDRTPSAGISINEGGTSIYHCWACGGKNKGPLDWLLRRLEGFTGDSYRELRQSIDGTEFIGGALPEWGSKARARSRLQFLDEDIYMDLFDSAVGHPYLKSRGLNRWATKTLQLMVDPADSRGEERIVFPVFTPGGRLVGFSGRATGEDVDPKVRDYFGLVKEEVLLGSHLLEPDDEYVMVVEGLFDYAKSVMYGFPAVAAMHAGLTAAQAKILRNLGKPVVLMYDDDNAGRDATDKAIEALLPYLPVSYVRYPKRRKVGGGKCVKTKSDPGSLSEAEMVSMVAARKIVV